MTRSYPHSAFNHGCTTRHGTMFNDLNLIDLGNTRKTIANRMQNYAVFIFESKSNGKCNKWAWLHAIEVTNFCSFRLIRRMINEPRTSGVESTWVKLDSHQWSTFQTSDIKAGVHQDPLLHYSWWEAPKFCRLEFFRTFGSIRFNSFAKILSIRKPFK